MPPKKKMGNKDKNYVEVRMHFLDRFLKDVANLPYLYESAELQVFLRPQGELEKCFKSMNPLITDEQL